MSQEYIVTTKEDLMSAIEACFNSPEHAHADKLAYLAKKPYLTPIEVQEYYGLNEGTLRNWRAQGRGPSYHQESKGYPVFYSHKDIEAFLQKTKKVTYA